MIITTGKRRKGRVQLRVNEDERGGARLRGEGKYEDKKEQERGREEEKRKKGKEEALGDEGK